MNTASAEGALSRERKPNPVETFFREGGWNKAWIAEREQRLATIPESQVQKQMKATGKDREMIVSELQHHEESWRLRAMAAQFAWEYAKAHPESLKLNEPGAVDLAEGGRGASHDVDNTSMQVASRAQGKEYWIKQGWTEEQAEQQFDSVRARGRVWVTVPFKSDGSSTQREVRGYRLKEVDRDRLFSTRVADQFMDLAYGSKTKH